ncbi:MAG: hypothetical protein ABH833_04440 [Parcubacteria group bacterium]
MKKEIEKYPKLLIAGGIVLLILIVVVPELTCAAGPADNLDFDGVVRLVTRLTCLFIYIVGGILIMGIIWSAIKIASSSKFSIGEKGSKESFLAGKRALTWTVIGGIVIFALPWILGFLAFILTDLLGANIPDITFTCY